MPARIYSRSRRFPPPAALAAVALALALGLALLLGPALLRAQTATTEQKLTASDAQGGDELGVSVAVSGDTAVVGAHLEDPGPGNAGAAYVFSRDQGGAGNWGQVTKLTASDAQGGDEFGVSVAVSGDTAVVGAYLEDPGPVNAGAAYVFSRDQGGTGNWGQVAKLTASDAEFRDHFGFSVAVSGGTAVVGAYFEDAGGVNNAGAAYIFRRDQGGTDNWGQVAKLTASDPESDDWFGWSVAVSGDTVVVGAWPKSEGGSTNAGAAYVFSRDQGGADNWGEVTKLTASDAEAFDRFGFSVAVSGGTAVVGAFLEDTGGFFAGAAYVFRRDQGGAGNWGQVAKLTASDADGDQFGWSVAVSGDTVVVGAHLEGAGGTEAGAAYIFERDQGGAGAWGEVGKLTASDAEAFDRFGQSVAVSGGTAVVGAHLEDEGGTDAGAAYIASTALADTTPPVVTAPADITVGPACPPGCRPAIWCSTSS